MAPPHLYIYIYTHTHTQAQTPGTEVRIVEMPVPMQEAVDRDIRRHALFLFLSLSLFLSFFLCSNTAASKRAPGTCTCNTTWYRLVYRLEKALAAKDAAVDQH